MSHSGVSVYLLFFASVRDRVGGKDNEKIILPNAQWQNYHQLISYICDELYPNIVDIKNNLAIAINEEYSLDGQITLQNNDRVALIPPITGG